MALRRVIRPGGGCDLSEAEEEELALDLAMRDDLSSRSAAATGVACPALLTSAEAALPQRPLPREALVAQARASRAAGGLPTAARRGAAADSARPSHLATEHRDAWAGWSGSSQLAATPRRRRRRAAFLAAFCEREPLASSNLSVELVDRSDQCRGVGGSRPLRALLPRHAFEPVHGRRSEKGAGGGITEQEIPAIAPRRRGGLPPPADEDDDISSSSEEEESDSRTSNSHNGSSIVKTCRVYL